MFFIQLYNRVHMLHPDELNEKVSTRRWFFNGLEKKVWKKWMQLL